MAAMKAKHAFGALERVDESIKSGVIDAYDILFVKNAEGKPYVGWVDKDGNKVVVSNDEEIAKLETELTAKANAEDVETKLAEKANVAEVEAAIATKADAETVKTLETELANKVSAEEVDAKVESAVAEKVEDAVKAEVEATVETAVEAKVETAVEAAVKEEVESVVKAEVEAAVEKTAEKTKYEVADVPAGTLVDYRDKEIRIMCPENTQWAKQSVGEGGDANTYYFTFKTFAPSDDAVGYIEHLGNQVDEEILTSFNVDENGRRYQPTWLGLAKYDEATGVWNYYGKTSEPSHYIGWDYQIDWYNADGVMIASDSVRINLSNEKCHSIIEPYYVGTMKKDVEVMIEEKVKEMESSYEIIEF